MFLFLKMILVLVAMPLTTILTFIGTSSPREFMPIFRRESSIDPCRVISIQDWAHLQKSKKVMDIRKSSFFGERPISRSAQMAWPTASNELNSCDILEAILKIVCVKILCLDELKINKLRERKSQQLKQCGSGGSWLHWQASSKQAWLQQMGGDLSTLNQYNTC